MQVVGSADRFGVAVAWGGVIAPFLIPLAWALVVTALGLLSGYVESRGAPA